jgi:hypothetical protein
MIALAFARAFRFYAFPSGQLSTWWRRFSGFIPSTSRASLLLSTFHAQVGPLLSWVSDLPGSTAEPMKELLPLSCPLSSFAFPKSYEKRKAKLRVSSFSGLAHPPFEGDRPAWPFQPTILTTLSRRTHRGLFFQL